MHQAAPISTDLERATRAARKMYPRATVKVRRGRVLAVEGDVIRWVRYQRVGRGNNYPDTA